MIINISQNIKIAISIGVVLGATLATVLENASKGVAMVIFTCIIIGTFLNMIKIKK